VAALALIAGCANPSTAPGASGGSGGATAPTSLQVTVDAGAGAAPTTWTLTCDPPGGSHPQASAACAQLEASKTDPFAKTPAGLMCSMIYGGGQTATVTGTFHGRRVATTFARTNGCEVARWQLVSALLVIVTGGGAGAG
jgi:Subtilisin inhibitor-like